MNAFLCFRPFRWLLWCLGIDSKAKVIALCFTVAVSMVLRNELVILLARSGLSEALTRIGVYGIGWLTYVAGAHFNAWCFKREWGHVGVNCKCDNEHNDI